MRTDREVTALLDPFINIYQQIEYDIIVEIARRLSTYDEMGGALEYQLKKLSEFQQLTPAVIKVFSKYSGKSEEEIKKLLSESQSLNIDMSMLNSAYDKGIIAVDPQIVMQSQRLREIAELSHKELSQSFKLIQTKAVESANQAYMNVLNKTYVEVASGSKSLEQALKGALQDMAKRGIHGATYKHTTANGKTRYTNYSIESVVRRDTVTAVHQLANKSSIEVATEVGADYVEVSSHLGARVSLVNPIANHAGWQGGIYKINGSDGKYRNLKEATGYPDDILGLGGVNCRHRMFAFIPGVSKPNPIKYGDTEENRRIYEATQKQRKFEREIRSLKKQIAAVECVKGDDDDNILQNLKLKLKHKQSQLQEHCNANGLKRDYSRELVSEQIVKNNQKGFTSYTGTSYNTNKAYKITDDAIENIPHFNIEELTAEQNNLLEIARKQVLISAQKEKVGVECANTVLLADNELLESEIGNIGSINIAQHNQWYYSVHNHPDNSGLSIGDVIEFSKRPYMLGIESISNSGKGLSALLKTEQCTIENVLKYQAYIYRYLDDCKHKFGNFSKLSFEKLSEITENVLKEANNYGYKYYTRQK